MAKDTFSLPKKEKKVLTEMARWELAPKEIKLLKKIVHLYQQNNQEWVNSKELEEEEIDFAPGLVETNWLLQRRNHNILKFKPTGKALRAFVTRKEKKPMKTIATLVKSLKKRNPHLADRVHRLTTALAGGEDSEGTTAPRRRRQDSAYELVFDLPEIAKQLKKVLKQKHAAPFVQAAVSHVMKKWGYPYLAGVIVKMGKKIGIKITRKEALQILVSYGTYIEPLLAVVLVEFVKKYMQKSQETAEKTSAVLYIAAGEGPAKDRPPKSMNPECMPLWKEIIQKHEKEIFKDSDPKKQWQVATSIFKNKCKKENMSPFQPKKEALTSEELDEVIQNMHVGVANIMMACVEKGDFEAAEKLLRSV